MNLLDPAAFAAKATTLPPALDRRHPHRRRPPLGRGRRADPARAEGAGLRFGDAALQLGLLSETTSATRSRASSITPTCGPATPASAMNWSPPASPSATPSNTCARCTSQLMLRWLDASIGHKALAIPLSPGAGEGRNFIAANLAVVFSQLGEARCSSTPTCAPRQHVLFKLGSSAGLSACSRAVPAPKP